MLAICSRAKAGGLVEIKDVEGEETLIRHNSIMLRDFSFLKRGARKDEKSSSQIFHRRLGTKSLEPFVGINNAVLACWYLGWEKLFITFKGNFMNFVWRGRLEKFNISELNKCKHRLPSGNKLHPQLPCLRFDANVHNGKRNAVKQLRCFFLLQTAFTGKLLFIFMLITIIYARCIQNIFCWFHELWHSFGWFKLIIRHDLPFRP